MPIRLLVKLVEITVAVFSRIQLIPVLNSSAVR
jgi:hypothetical protein